MTVTDLTNRALARIGQTTISSIDDTNSKAAVTAKSFWRSVADEILMQHRWNCATSRATLAEIAVNPDWGYKHAFQLPGTFLRLMELNGEQVDGSEEFFEIEEKKILKTDASVAKIRFIKQIEVSDMDPSLFEVVACKLAAELAVPLTQNIALRDSALMLMERAMGAARRVDAISTGSGENRPLNRALTNSPLLQVRGDWMSPGRFYNKYPTWTYNP